MEEKGDDKKSVREKDRQTDILRNAGPHIFFPQKLKTAGVDSCLVIWWQLEKTVAVTELYFTYINRKVYGLKIVVPQSLNETVTYSFGVI